MNKANKILEGRYLLLSVSFSCCTLKVISHHYKRKRAMENNRRREEKDREGKEDSL